eukprot:12407427-Karenia_brevis.AAC.1
MSFDLNDQFECTQHDTVKNKFLDMHALNMLKKSKLMTDTPWKFEPPFLDNLAAGHEFVPDDDIWLAASLIQHPNGVTQ